MSYHYNAPVLDLVQGAGVVGAGVGGPGATERDNPCPVLSSRTVTTRHFSEADLPSGEGESRAVHLAFINQNLDIGAATAWQGYQTVGRCAIVVVTQWADVRQPWTAGTTPVGVMARKKALRMLDEINPPARADLARLLRQYDPLQEMVFCFLRTDYGVSSYRVANPGLTPPEAYEAMKGQMADFILTDAEMAEYIEKSERQRRGK